MCTHNPHKILYAEDDPDIRKIARYALESVGGFEVLMCSSGVEALKMAPGFAPDIFLLDVMMPELDGPATLRSIRKIDRFKDTPIVFLTSKVQSQDISEFEALGACSVIAKPFDPVSLGNQVVEIWSKFRAKKAA